MHVWLSCVHVHVKNISTNTTATSSSCWQSSEELWIIYAAMKPVSVSVFRQYSSWGWAWIVISCMWKNVDIVTVLILSKNVKSEFKKYSLNSFIFRTSETMCQLVLVSAHQNIHLVFRQLLKLVVRANTRPPTHLSPRDFQKFSMTFPYCFTTFPWLHLNTLKYRLT